VIELGETHVRVRVLSASAASTAPLASRYFFSCFTGTKVLALQVQKHLRSRQLQAAYSVYLLYCYTSCKSTKTDPARPAAVVRGVMEYREVMQYRFRLLLLRGVWLVYSGSEQRLEHCQSLACLALLPGKHALVQKYLLYWYKGTDTDT
jgi:hypothetical protein